MVTAFGGPPDRSNAEEPDPLRRAVREMGAGRSPRGAVARLRQMTAVAFVGLLMFSGYGTLIPTDVRCSLPGAVGCPGGVLGPLPAAGSTANTQWFNISMYDYGFWIIDTVSGANETKVWTVFEGFTVHVNVTSLPADPSVGGTAYHGIGIEINATGTQLLQIAAGVNKWAAGSFVAPSHAYYHQHIWCTVYCGPGHGGMQVHNLDVVPATAVPQVTAQGSPASGTAPLLVSFTGSVVGGTPPLTTSWNFGDGTVVNGTVNTTHTFTLSATYTATLTATDSAGFHAAGSVTVTVAAAAPLNASATLTPTSGVVPFLVQLSGTASGGTGSDSFAWSLGDGYTATGASASHVYTSPGLYSVGLVVTDSAGVSSTVVSAVTARSPTGTLNVTGHATPANGSAPLNVTLSEAAPGAGAPVTVLWMLGDGSTSSSASPTHTYTAAGHYLATVYVTDGTGRQGSALVSVDVQGGPSVPLRAWLTADPTAGGPPLPITASVSIEGGTGTYTTPQWSFGDGGASAGVMVSHSYAQVGTFSLRVALTDSAGTPANATLPITVEGLGLTISVNSSLGDAPFSVRAAASVVGGTGTYAPIQWTWGDGASSSGSPANHTYAAPVNGTVQIHATVTDSGGSTASGVYALQILPPPVANLTAAVAAVAYPPTNASFTLQVTGGSGNYSTRPLWDFGDGAATRGPSPQNHTYEKPGRFRVTVVTNDSFGRSANATIWVTISGGAAAQGSTPGGGGAWTFTGVADPNTAALWLLGFVAASGLAVMFLKRPVRPVARPPGSPKNRTATPAPVPRTVPRPPVREEGP